MISNVSESIIQVEKFSHISDDIKQKFDIVNKTNFVKIVYNKDDIQDSCCILVLGILSILQRTVLYTCDRRV